MLLIGMFDSPFVRRVAISMMRLNMPFEHADWSVGKDFERIRAHNPVARVPTLVLDGGEVVIDSAAILDYLDEQAGNRALLPRGGDARRHALQWLALATGAAEKGVMMLYESAFRPPEKRYQQWLDRCSTQVHSALEELERRCAQRADTPWLMGSEMMQPDITLACVFTFLTDAGLAKASAYPCVDALRQRCEVTPEFVSTHRPFFTPQS